MSTQGLALRAASWSADMTTQRLSPRAGRHSLDTKKPPASSSYWRPCDARTTRARSWRALRAALRCT